MLPVDCKSRRHSFVSIKITTRDCTGCCGTSDIALRRYSAIGASCTARVDRRRRRRRSVPVTQTVQSRGRSRARLFPAGVGVPLAMHVVRVVVVRYFVLWNPATQVRVPVACCRCSQCRAVIVTRVATKNKSALLPTKSCKSLRFWNAHGFSPVQ